MAEQERIPALGDDVQSAGVPTVTSDNDVLGDGRSGSDVEGVVGRLSFSSALPNLQIAWDSTSLGTLKECPRKYYYSIVLGRTTRLDNVHLSFGIYIHRGIEKYHRLLAGGLDWRTAVRETVKFILHETWNYSINKPWMTDDSNKNRWTLVRSLVWYFDEYRNDLAKVIPLADGTPAVELSFRFEIPLPAITGGYYMLCGHIDRMTSFQDLIYFGDSKTTKNTIDSNFFAKFNPDNQMSMYNTAGKVVWKEPVQGGIIDGMQVAVEFTRFRRGFTLRSDDQISEYLHDAAYWIKQAERYAEENYWPMNDKSCHHYGGCPFRDVCAKPAVVREAWLTARFVTRKWDPLVIRGDI